MENSERDRNTRPPYLPPRNLYADQEATVRTGHGIDSKLGKEFLYVVCLFNFYAKFIMQNAGLDESQARIKISRRNISNLSYANDTTLMEESKEELKSLLKVKEKSEIVGLKLNIQKTKIIASSSITSWQIDGEKVDRVADFLMLQNHCGQ